MTALIPGHAYRPEQTLPHRGRMLLLDEIDHYEGDWIRATVIVHSQTPFCESGGVPSWVGIEWMAQAASAYAGIEQLQAGGQPRIGLLLGTRRYTTDVTYFTPGQRLSVTARLVMRDASDLAVFDCVIEDGGRVLASAQIKAYQPEDIARFMA